MIVEIDQSVPAFKSYAAERTRGLYNVEADDGSRFQMTVDVPTDGDWQIGVIVGPSGSGKTSIARALREMREPGTSLSSPSSFHEWYAMFDDTPIIEYLSRADSYAKATAALSAVGLGSVPSWLRPYRVLSNGEQFRAGLAELLLEVAGGKGKLKVDARVYIDEFTSVLDRQVAKVGAGAFAKAWRRRTKGKIILITPHYDVLDWIEPDWWIDTAEGLDQMTEGREVVRAQGGDFQAASHRTRYRGDRVGSVEC